jgi:hypothetical protein
VTKRTLDDVGNGQVVVSARRRRIRWIGFWLC